MSKVVAFYEDISRLIVGTVVEETDQIYRLINPVYVAVRSPQAGQFQTEFVPYETLSVDPQLLPLRALCDDTYDAVFTFQRQGFKKDNVPLRADILDGYKQRFGKTEPNVIKLF